MEFIPLSEVINRIAETIEIDEHLENVASFEDKKFQCIVTNFWEENNPKIEWKRKRAFAARVLNEALHHSEVSQLPQWMEYDKDKSFAVKNDALQLEATELLTRTWKWASELQEKCAEHIRNASAGYRTDLIELDFVQKQNRAVPAEEILRPIHIGFDRAEILSFLAANRIDHKLEGKDGKLKQSKKKEKNEINQEWQTEIESMADKLIRSKKKSQATKGKLAKTLGDEIGVDPGTIERQTRKTW